MTQNVDKRRVFFLYTEETTHDSLNINSMVYICGDQGEDAEYKFLNCAYKHAQN